MDSPHPLKSERNTMATCGQQMKEITENERDHRDNRFDYGYVTLSL